MTAQCKLKTVSDHLILVCRKDWVVSDNKFGFFNFSFVKFLPMSIILISSSGVMFRCHVCVTLSVVFCKRFIEIGLSKVVGCTEVVQCSSNL